MSTSPRVTVLMTVYNGVRFLPSAIESVLAQSFDDFEFLIVDDASTDSSVDLIRSYADSRIRLVSNETNIGQPASLNSGLNLASGQYVARLDQDDMCLPGRFRLQVSMLDNRPDVGIVGAWEYTIDADGRKIRRWRPRIENFGAFLGILAIGLCPVWHPSAMYRRQEVLDLGGYDPAYTLAADYDLWTRIAMKRLNGAIVPEFLTSRRIHGGRQSAARSHLQREATARSHENFIRQVGDCSDVRILGRLLRLEDDLWNACSGKDELAGALRSLDDLLAEMGSKLDLTENEHSALNKVIFGRLGLGVRFGRQLIGLPAPVFYTLLIGLSPMLLASLRRPAAFLKERLPELRYPGHLF